jgi:hypothetical protein
LPNHSNQSINAKSLFQMTADKAALEREVNALRSDNDRLRANTETMVAEKWELSAANAGYHLLPGFH